MASVREPGTPISVDDALGILLNRHRTIERVASAIVIVLILITVSLFPGGVLGPAILLLVAFLACLIPVLVYIEKERVYRFRRALAVLNGLAGLAELNVRRLDLTSKVRAPDPSVPPLTLWVTGDDARMRLEVQWQIPADVLAIRQYSYSDLPGVLEEVVAVRDRLATYEYLRTDLAKGLLVSTVLPGWKQWSRVEESPETVRDRVLDRWRRMESTRRRALLERVFAPGFVRSDRPGPPDPEVFGSWCPKCWTERLATSADTCWRCHARLWTVWSSAYSERSLRWKMDDARSRYTV